MRRDINWSVTFLSGKMHVGGHCWPTSHLAEHPAEVPVRNREEGPLQGGRRETSGPQLGSAHQATQW